MYTHFKGISWDNDIKCAQNEEMKKTPTKWLVLCVENQVQKFPPKFFRITSQTTKEDRENPLSMLKVMPFCETPLPQYKV